MAQADTTNTNWIGFIDMWHLDKLVSEFGGRSTSAVASDTNEWTWTALDTASVGIGHFLFIFICSWSLPMWKLLSMFPFCVINFLTELFWCVTWPLGRLINRTMIRINNHIIWLFFCRWIFKYLKYYKYEMKAI